MSERLLTLEVVDKDGALRETREAAMNRSDFVKRIFGGGAVITGGVMLAGLPALALGAPSASQDVAILNFALTLEYLEAEFYTRAVASGALSGEALRFARVVKSHEVAHVNFLKNALKNKAVKKPSFDFKGTTEDQGLFLKTAQVLEDTGVAAYNGQGPLLTRKTLPAAASVVSVEARHAAWVRDINKVNPAPVAFDVAKTKAQILSAVGGTGFITG
jgi:hypothetical protein